MFWMVFFFLITPTGLRCQFLHLGPCKYCHGNEEYRIACFPVSCNGDFFFPTFTGNEFKYFHCAVHLKFPGFNKSTSDVFFCLNSRAHLKGIQSALM